MVKHIHFKLSIFMAVISSLFFLNVASPAVAGNVIPLIIKVRNIGSQAIYPDASAIIKGKKGGTSLGGTGRLNPGDSGTVRGDIWYEDRGMVEAIEFYQGRKTWRFPYAGSGPYYIDFDKPTYVR